MYNREKKELDAIAATKIAVTAMLILIKILNCVASAGQPGPIRAGKLATRTQEFEMSESLEISGHPPAGRTRIFLRWAPSQAGLGLGLGSSK